MLALTSPYLWYVTRATGLVVLVLFSLVVVLGTLVATRVGGTRVGRFEVNELHRSLSVVAMIFLVIHILTTVLDSFVATGWLSTIVPLTSRYKRVPVALGTVGFDLIVTVWISSLLKVRLKNETWRFIHWFSWLGFVAALAHGLLSGTDSRHGVGLAVVVVCAVAVGGATLWRVASRPARAAGRTALSPIAADSQASTAPTRADPSSEHSGRALG